MSADEGTSTKKKKSTAEKRKTPVGADGLTKYQRHYRKKKSAKEALEQQTTQVSVDSSAERERLRPEREISQRVASQVSQQSGHSSSERVDLEPKIDVASAVFAETETTIEKDDNMLIIEKDDNMLPISSFDWRPPRELRPNEDEPQLPDVSHAPRGFAVYDDFLWNRAITADWSRRWGGTANWPHSLEIELDRLKANGPEGISKFYRRLWQHEHRGRYLLYEIQKQTIMTLPPNDEAIMQLWNLQQEQVIVLTRGLTILELTASVAERTMFTIGGDEFVQNMRAAHLSPNTALYVPSRRKRAVVEWEEREMGREEEEIAAMLLGGAGDE